MVTVSSVVVLLSSSMLIAYSRFKCEFGRLWMFGSLVGVLTLLAMIAVTKYASPVVVISINTMLVAINVWTALRIARLSD